MLTTEQAAAKQAAHQVFGYRPRLRYFEKHHIASQQRHPLPDQMPRFEHGIAGIGIADDVLRVYLLEGHTSDIEIPDQIEDLRTERVFTTGFRSLTPRRHSPLSPTPCGVSIGHHRITYGTLGCLVDTPSSRCILSNSHVLTHPDGHVGDEIMQPGPYHSRPNGPSRPIGKLADHQPIEFGSAVNHIDAAVATLDARDAAIPDIMTIGRPVNPPAPTFLNQPVAKHGAYSGLTHGTVVDTSFDGNVYFGSFNHLPAYFENQIVIVGNSGPFSHGGDSGSLVVDTAGCHPVGLLFAGDGTRTLANPIQAVLNRFGATIVTA